MAHRSRRRRTRRLRTALPRFALAGLAFGLAFTATEQADIRSRAVPAIAAPPAAPGDIFNEMLDSTSDLFDLTRNSRYVSRFASSEEVEWDLPNLDHPRVDYWVERFMTDKHDDFATFLKRKGKYEPMIRQKLRERGMPEDLIYLAMIESGFRPSAYSPAHASGLWQFIAATGKRYGLDINRAVDERNDPEKATDAALSYLSDLHRRFGSWYLAAAAYNTGENRVGRIMREVTGSERGNEESYYRIWDRLPRETRDYVPLMVAAGRIAKDPARFGFGDVQTEAPPAVKLVKAAPATPLTKIAHRSGTSVSEIRQLNPQLKLNRTRNDQYSAVRVPGD